MGAVPKPLEPDEMRPVSDHSRTGMKKATDMTFLRHSIHAYDELEEGLEYGYYLRVGDVDAAFPLLPLAPILWPFFLFQWFDLDLDDDAPGEPSQLFAHVTGDFGAAGLPGTFKIFFSDCVQGMARSELILTVPMTVYVDDMGLYGPCRETLDRVATAFKVWLHALGIYIKEIKDKVAAQLQLMLGFWWDTLSRTRTLEERKFKAYVDMLFDFASRKTLALREMQQIAGRMMRAVMTLPPGAACFLANLFALTRGLSLPWQQRRSNRATRADFKIVHDLLLLNLGRGYFSFDQFARAPAVDTDASKEARYAGGGYASRCGRYRLWRYGNHAARQMIDFLEGDTVVVAMQDLGRYWKRCVVPFNIDNSAFQRSAVKGWSRAERLTLLLRQVFVLSIQYEFIGEFHWVSTHVNVYADALSRPGGEPLFLRLVDETDFLDAGAELRRHPDTGGVRTFGSDYLRDMERDTRANEAAMFEGAQELSTTGDQPPWRLHGRAYSSDEDGDGPSSSWIRCLCCQWGWVIQCDRCDGTLCSVCGMGRPACPDLPVCDCQPSPNWNPYLPAGMQQRWFELEWEIREEPPHEEMMLTALSANFRAWRRRLKRKFGARDAGNSSGSDDGKDDPDDRGGPSGSNGSGMPGRDGTDEALHVVCESDSENDKESDVWQGWASPNDDCSDDVEDEESSEDEVVCVECDDDSVDDPASEDEIDYEDDSYDDEESGSGDSDRTESPPPDGFFWKVPVGWSPPTEGNEGDAWEGLTPQDHAPCQCRGPCQMPVDEESFEWPNLGTCENCWMPSMCDCACICVCPCGFWTPPEGWTAPPIWDAAGYDSFEFAVCKCPRCNNPINEFTYHRDGRCFQCAETSCGVCECACYCGCVGTYTPRRECCICPWRPCICKDAWGNRVQPPRAHCVPCGCDRCPVMLQPGEGHGRPPRCESCRDSNCWQECACTCVCSCRGEFEPPSVAVESEAPPWPMHGRQFSSDEDGDGPPGRGVVQELTVTYPRASIYDGLPDGLAEEVDDLLDNRLSTSAMRSMSAALSHWDDVCAQFGWRRVISSEDPHRGGMLASYVMHLVRDTTLVASSISNYVWALRSWNKLQRQLDPIYGVIEWSDFMESVMVVAHVAAEPRKAIPVDLVRRALQRVNRHVFWEVQAAHLMLSLLFSFARSESPLPKAFTGEGSFDPDTNLMVEDFRVAPSANGNDAHAMVRLKATKTDQRKERPEAAGNQDWVLIGDVDGDFSILAWTRELFALHGGQRAPESPFYLDRDRRRPYLYGKAMADVRELLARVTTKEDAYSYGLHSFRVTGYDRARQHDLELAVAHGGWRSTAHRRYDRFGILSVLRLPSVITTDGTSDAVDAPSTGPPPAVPVERAVGRTRTARRVGSARRSTRHTQQQQADSPEVEPVSPLVSPSPLPDLRPLCGGRADEGRRVLVPASVWPDWPCDEGSGEGWLALITRSRRRRATVRFLHAVDDSGRHYTEYLATDVLQPV